MPAFDKRSLLKMMTILARYVPIVARGLAVAFFILAGATAALDIGNYPTPEARYLVAGLFFVFSLVSIGIAYSVKPLMRFVLRRLI